MEGQPNLPTQVVASKVIMAMMMTITTGIVYEKDENNDNIVYENNETKVAGGFPASSGPLPANPCKV